MSAQTVHSAHKGAHEFFGSSVLGVEPIETGLDDFEVLNGTHPALIRGQGAELLLVKSRETRRERFNHVAEFFERDARGMDGLGLFSADGAPTAGGARVSLMKGVNDRSRQACLTMRVRGFVGEFLEHYGNPFFEFVDFERGDFCGGFNEAGMLAPLQVLVEQGEFREFVEVFGDEQLLDLDVAQAAKGFHGALEGAAGFFRGAAGKDGSEQIQLGDEASCGDSQLMDGVFGRVLLEMIASSQIKHPAVSKGSGQAQSYGKRRCGGLSCFGRRKGRDRRFRGTRERRRGNGVEQGHGGGVLRRTADKISCERFPRFHKVRYYAWSGRRLIVAESAGVGRKKYSAKIEALKC